VRGRPREKLAVLANGPESDVPEAAARAGAMLMSAFRPGMERQPPLFLSRTRIGWTVSRPTEGPSGKR
jgi:hypothetical protein